MRIGRIVAVGDRESEDLRRELELLSPSAVERPLDRVFEAEEVEEETPELVA